MEDLKVALVISTYNWPEALELILRSVLIQSKLPYEILIADDGSTNSTKEVIEKYRPQINCKLTHVWHEDKGFMKSIILNKTIAKSTSEYIIQIDGDCFMHPKFVENHKDNIEKNLYLYGTRVRIKEKYVKNIYALKNLNISFFKSGLKKRLRNIYLPSIAKSYKKKNSISPKYRGCNFSFWKDDFIKINGYDEDMKGWGREDSELAIRLHNNGVKTKRLKFSGIVYHLDHKEESRDFFNINDEIQENTIKNKLKRCTNGIDKYL